MTLKTLKPKENISLILDDEFIQYCKLNNIEDVEKLARETFNRGFTILKYGQTPNVEIKLVPVSKETAAIRVPNRYPEADTPILVVPKTIQKQIEQEQIQNMKKKADLYDE